MFRVLGLELWGYRVGGLGLRAFHGLGFEGLRFGVERIAVESEKVPLTRYCPFGWDPHKAHISFSGG